ncbi:hypothetical protein IMCC3317_34190 [Kordia antarctica]|uniref:NACHT domain-containing protein n=1 Tax=Kordia antarctica TaxID=1218801 RepID=A0A7L4ZN49_9FLAO|nr:NACHT domain-containing protein [Kordia antarctica]QHI38035.1 hypothetical protein IMCC3317_34190 [Kordia antarctica]
MNQNPIINVYRKAKEKGVLVYFKDLHKGQIMNCLKDFLGSSECNEAHQKKIINYYSQDVKTINQVIRVCKADDFKPIIGFLNLETSPSRHGIFPLTKILLEFDIQLGQELKKIQKNLKAPFITNNLFREKIKEFYLTDSEFTTIKINGDLDSKLGILSMEDYYIQLSYTSYKDICNQDSLLKLEKEYSYSKINKNKNSFYKSNLAKDYVAKNIIFNNKVLIIGNPGVGKSTYAKNLCYKWAKEYKNSKSERIIIYIQLRYLNFEEESYLVSFINRQYFSAIDSKLFSLNALENFQLILDGFDELTFENQILLISRIKRHNYIILSRPYGLINHDLNHDISIQIDGFNSSGIEYYLDNILKSKRKKKNFLKLVEQNRVLKDYASTPLMLSFMSLIYLTSKNIKKDLSSIKSIYDLQEKVYSWVLSYAIKKKSIGRNKIKHSIEEFAYNMQIHKKLKYLGDFEDPFESTVEKLSAIGLGSQRELNSFGFQWQFSFNTITFQEFLAARYLKNKFRVNCFFSI